LLRAQPHARLLAITGTNGKSTTTALSGHILASAGRQVASAAISGRQLWPCPRSVPRHLCAGALLLSARDHPSLKPTVAMLLNITPDHIDRHGDMAGYIAAKERIFQRQTADDTAIIGIDDEPSRAMHDRLAVRNGPRVVAISSIRAVPTGVSVRRELGGRSRRQAPRPSST